ncbi:MAG: hypothetical protein OJF51_002528 [Nitrospira sp.]|nr:MAG: hypothetical protein OJF51_002528 [Nitrospira sp.]
MYAREKYRINYDTFFATTVENVLRTTGCSVLNIPPVPGCRRTVDGLHTKESA